LARREFIGLSLEGTRLRLAVVEAGKKQIIVKQLSTYELPRTTSEPAAALPEKPTYKDDFDDLIFGGDENDESKAVETTTWDMTEEGVDDAMKAESNEALLASLISAISPKSANLALAIPSGMALHQIFTDADYKKRKKKELKALVSDRLTSVYERPLTEDNFAWMIRDHDGAMVVSSFDGANPLLEIADATLPLISGKLFIRDIKPEELYLVGLVNANYDIRDTEYTVVIHIHEHHTQVIIMHGSEIVSILPTINEGSKSNRVMKTIFSKLLFELDRGQLPTIDRIVLTGDTVKGKAVTFLEEQFMEVQIGQLALNPLKVILPEGFAEDVLPYATAIGAAWAASGNDASAFPKLSLIPPYVLTRQAVFKLDWHGYLLLALIAVSPFMFNQAYKAKQNEIETKIADIANLNQQISENKVLSTVVDLLTAEMGAIDVNTALLDTLAKDTQTWSYTLSLLNSEVSRIQGVWIQNIQYDEKTIIIQGFSLHRDRIPKISNLFENAIIQQVIEKEERKVKLYEFLIQVQSITSRSDLMSPLPVEPPTLNLTGQEQSIKGGIIQN
jgi:hypothetical protein